MKLNKLGFVYKKLQNVKSFLYLPLNIISIFGNKIYNGIVYQ